MFKISFKRSIAVLLTLVLLLTSLPVTAFAETASASTETEDEYIYYSDLFYGYSYYLNDVNFMSDNVKAQGAMNIAFNQYLDSPQFTWAAISKHISLTTSMSDLMIAYSDMLGLTNVTYTNNLNAANKKFVEELFVLKTGDIDSISKDTKCVGQFKKILSTLQKVWKAIYDANDIKTYDTFVDLAYADLQTYCTNLKPLLPSLKSGTYTAINELLSKADDTQEILDLFTALIISLGMEEVRLDTIQEIISTQKSDSILYEGMNRLHSQLKNGFVGYFIGTYFEDKAIEEVAKHTSKFITKTIMEEVAQGIGASSAKAMTSIFGAVTASISLLNTIVFDWIFGDQIPSIEDYQVTMILAQYSNLMYDSVIAKQAVFQAPFETKEIEKYETLMNAYAASMRCALDECAALVDPISSTTEQNIKNTKTLFGDNFYNSYIDGVKSTVKSISPENRVITDYGTWTLTEDTVLGSGSDKIEENILYCVGGVLNSNLLLKGNRATSINATIPSNETMVITGNLRMDYRARLINNGECNIYGDVIPGTVYANGAYDRFFLENNQYLSIGGNIVTGASDINIIQKNENAIISVSGNCSIKNDKKIEGTIIFDGIEEQIINGVQAQNIEVRNPKGIKYGGSVNLYGEYNSNGNPINNNGFKTRTHSGCSFKGNYDYGDILPIGEWTYSGYLKANIVIESSNGWNISEQSNLILDGNVVSKGKAIYNYGNLEVLGSIGNSANSVYISNYGTALIRGDLQYAGIYNSGYLEILGTVYLTRWQGITMDSETAIIKFGGNVSAFELGYMQITAGTIIYSGIGLQNVCNVKAPIIVIDNSSEEGVVFTSSIFPSVLFDHRGNHFTVKSGSTFVDYDGDGMKDNVDPEPTVGNPCMIHFASEDTEKGALSLSEVETIGGTKITVTATPTFKYDFSKWVNSAGTTVSTSAECTIVATGDETYTAVFTKRQQPITTQTEGGKINVASKAEIESEVKVTVTENDGYVYTEGSLAHNGIPVENGSFIMPDEAVTLTAEFVRNENYFALNDALTTAKNYTYQSYSKESFANLTSVISAAEVALVNNITAEESEKQIALLQAAIDGLEDKYIATVTLKTTPTLYINVPDMINDISVLVTYDNGTTITVTGADCVIEGYDATILGEHSIMVTYGEVTGALNVTVQKRLLEECTISEIIDQLYDGIKAEYTQTPVVAYDRTEEVLTEDVDFTVEYSDNTNVGEATIIINGIGNYTGSQTVTFNIYCEHNYSVIAQKDPTCTKTGYQTEKCAICGKVNSYENIVTEGLPESEHNYANSIDVSYYYTNNGASSLALKFSSSTQTENRYDSISIYDNTDTLLGAYSGVSLAGQTITVPGDAVRIRLTSDSSVVKYGFSLDSVTAYFDHLLLPTIEHNYGDWSTVTEATPASTGIKHKLCTECGDEMTEEIPAVEALAFKGASLTLHHNLAINYKVDKALFETVGYTNPYVVFEVGGKTTTVKAYAVEGERYVFRFRNIAPNQMNDTIYATLYATYNGVEYASETREYSVAEYCYSTLNKYSADDYAELRTLLVDLLHYGAQSQLYTKYNTENLVNANLTEAQLAWGTVEDPTLINSLNTAYETVEDPLITWKGASLNLNDSVSMRFKFITDDINGLSLKITGETDEWNITANNFVLEDGVYSVRFSGLNAGQMSEKVYLTMYKDGVAVSNTVCYSIESYAYSKQDSTIEHLSDLVKAMMKYGNSAHSYVN